MMKLARHSCIVLADSDIAVRPDYLARIAAALEKPGVGGVTCLYRGVPAAGIWSALSVLAINGHFFPNTLVGMRVGLATPCFGSTIALRREVLDAIGGFAAFSDTLADDYAIGAALREKGLEVAVPRFLVAHACTETSFAELWRHELRWARTIRVIDPVGYAGSAVTHPLAFAILAGIIGMPLWGAAAALLAISCRIVLLHAASRGHGTDSVPYRLVPLRDCLSFAIFAWSFCGRSLTWRGTAYHVGSDGNLTAD
jgi:ceramide glucosyltransferase